MTFTHLDWDSNFFKKKIGRLDITSADKFFDIDACMQSKKNEGYKLIYVFTPCEYEIHQSPKYKLVDKKVVYEINLAQLHDSYFDYKSQYVEKYEGSVTDDLYELAYTSGQYSRFKLDSFFENAAFYNLYKKWIENAVADEAVFVYKNNYKEEGLITLNYKRDEGVIGLFAVKPKTQCKGIGRALIQHVYSELLNKQIYILSVATQMENKKACAFYKACGMKQRVVTNIYHCWL